MPKIARQGDTSDHGAGNITTAVWDTVTVNSMPIAIAGPGALGPQGALPDALFSPPVHPQGGGGVLSGPVEGSTNIFAGGYPVHRFHDARACGAETITASPNVFGNGQAQIRQDGGTVSSPKASPAAPLGFQYPYDEIIMVTGSPGIYIKPDTTLWVNVNGINNLVFIGTELRPLIEFEESLEEFDVPDLDLARKTNVGQTSDFNSTTVLGGLATVGFPSYGNVPIDQLGLIEGTPSVANYEKYFTQTDQGTWTRNSYSGVQFTIANESGNQTTTLGIIVFPPNFPNIS